MDDHFCKEKSCSVIRIMPKALKKYITNIDIDNEEIVITDAPKESLDVAILRMIYIVRTTRSKVIQPS